ncbi:bidirectional hydrogenase complex protein HoxE [Desulfofustis glycolicus]|uniref:NAD(P)-dependent nickel-iron dehydrogenase diaphorase component subunit HoxE n=1 Tax=Desulfofustis glycolicus DSM 9705 TaxID=1121409 RepID=A0A1M5XRM7_9BACT|nr:bidirectional hydrogenase complex protein HoxE [Desulfofustis glycolicus]MCB2217835.1 bidirectional hydrogenase complex protein HoxE [Desulfobulbaceae bacterium]SHI02440.1 NAD(P)-dependent nickel-iron dehydrogenase diaphorase component subunit HoxE [Desulfofustis glycolicus DSM 9705]
MATTSKHKNAPAMQDVEHADPRYKQVDRTLKRFRYRQDALIEVLHTAQESFGFLSDELMIYIARELKLPQSWVYGVATFYHFFSLKPQGEHTCVVCMGTACYVKRSAEIVARIQGEYSIKPGETTADGKLSLATARCLGSCGLAPVLVVDNEVLGKETPESTLQKIREVVATSPDHSGEPADTVNLQEQEEHAS